MMATIRSILLLSILAPTVVTAGDPPPSIYSKFEVFHDLISSFRSSSLRGRDEFSISIQNDVVKKKSVALAAIYSLLLPGMGELYADGFSSGRYFLIAEGVLWLGYATLDIYGNVLRDDARAYAVSRAGVNPAGKDDQFYIDIGNFLNITEYNEKQLRDREPEKLYDLNAGYAWRWESDAARAEYRAQRISSETMYNNRNFVVAAVIINHVLSAINAGRSAMAYNRGLEDPVGDLRMKASVAGGLSNPHGIVFTIVKEF